MTEFPEPLTPSILYKQTKYFNDKNVTKIKKKRNIHIASSFCEYLTVR